MGLLDWIRRKPVLFSLQPADAKMIEASRVARVRPHCECLEPQYGNQRYVNLSLHSDVQNTECEGWRLLLELIEEAASKKSKEFAPGLHMPPNLWSQVVTLPASISKLTAVRKLYLYSSHLVRLPAEIGDLSNLEELDLYTSYRLHWVPFEVTRCRRLKSSRVSTRALYGNYKYRPPFPKLGVPDTKRNLPANCSVCGKNRQSGQVCQAWLSLLVATDVLPLLVNACSEECIQSLPAPAYGYVDRPHRGGLNLQQPPAAYFPPDPKRKWMRE
jgi:hypothetical protein